RDIERTDYLTMSTSYDLPEQVDTLVREQIMQFLKSIMLNEEALHYLLKWLASCLDGHNKEETFAIFRGTGRNGKGVLCNLLLNAFGGERSTSYCHNVAASMFTRERPSSSSPCVDLLNIKGKRIVLTSGPEKGKPINCGFLKFLTGNDVISGR